jgi:N-acetyl-alpha-D-glucosaminyl L-malate synthase BshA
MHMSNFRPVKRPTDVVEIFRRILAKVPAVLLMVGDGPERAAAEWLAREYGIDGKVYFLGKRDDAEDIMAISDLLLLPSDTESFGLVALEAMACEVPVVVSNVGGLPEVVTSGMDGYLVEPRDIAGMAAKAIEILADDSVLTRMGKHARESAQSRFCSTRIIPLYEEYYRRVLSGI